MGFVLKTVVKLKGLVVLDGRFHADLINAVVIITGKDKGGCYD